jgi:Lon protease-like protein
MFELPLFPLNTVLFPGMPMALRIFEERYKLMIGKCIEEERPFGVVLIKKGSEVLGPIAEPHLVGCTAEIIEVEELKHGRMNIGAIGRERFQIVSLNQDSSYLVGQVERFPLTGDDSEIMDTAARRLRPWVINYMDELSRIEGLELDSLEVPEDPKPMAYLAATLLQIPPGQKQKLLATEQATKMLVDMHALYRREVAFLKVMIEHDEADQGSFSLN